MVQHRQHRRRRARAAAAMAAVLTLTLALEACTTVRGPQWIYPSDPPAMPAASPPVPAPASAVAAPPAVAPSPSASAIPIARGERRVEVPILYYHRVIAPPRGFRHWPRARRERFLAYDVLPAAFEAQLDWLQANGYTTILPRDLAAYWDDGTPLPVRPVIITFDDGTHDWAGPVLRALRKRGMVAAFYLTIQAIPRGGMTWREMRRLVRAGMGIGAHGLHHVQLAGPGIRRPAGEARMRREVERPRVLIEQRLGVVPDSFAYVGGGFDATLRRLVREAGYTTARSIVPGTIQDRTHRHTLRVIRIGSRTDVINVVRGTLRPGLPQFSRLMRGQRS